MEQVTVDIDKDGNVTVGAEGVKGPDCEKLTAAIEEALGDAAKRTLTAEHRERVKDALLRKDYREMVAAGTNVSRITPMADLARIMTVEIDCLRRERARTQALEAIWPAHAASPWLPLDSPLSQVPRRTSKPPLRSPHRL